MSHRDCIDEIEISSPCTVPWDGMAGDERVRFCGQCHQSVYNVEALGGAEARRLIADREQRVCLRILRRPDGTVVTADCWSRIRAARRRGLLPFLAMLVVAGLAELMAIGVGLTALGTIWSCRRAVPSPRPTLAVDVPLRRLMGAPRRRPPPPSEHPVHKVGERTVGLLGKRSPPRDLETKAPGD